MEEGIGFWNCESTQTRHIGLIYMQGIRWGISPHVGVIKHFVNYKSGSELDLPALELSTFNKLRQWTY